MLGRARPGPAARRPAPNELDVVDAGPCADADGRCARRPAGARLRTRVPSWRRAPTRATEAADEADRSGAPSGEKLDARRSRAIGASSAASRAAGLQIERAGGEDRRVGSSTLAALDVAGAASSSGSVRSAQRAGRRAPAMPGDWRAPAERLTAGVEARRPRSESSRAWPRRDELRGLLAAYRPRRQALGLAENPRVERLGTAARDVALRGALRPGRGRGAASRSSSRPSVRSAGGAVMTACPAPGLHGDDRRRATATCAGTPRSRRGCRPRGPGPDPGSGRRLRPSGGGSAGDCLRPGCDGLHRDDGYCDQCGLAARARARRRRWKPPAAPAAPLPCATARRPCRAADTSSASRGRARSGGSRRRRQLHDARPACRLRREPREPRGRAGRGARRCPTGTRSRCRARRPRGARAQAVLRRLRPARRPEPRGRGPAAPRGSAPTAARRYSFTPKLWPGDLVGRAVPGGRLHRPRRTGLGLPGPGQERLGPLGGAQGAARLRGRVGHGRRRSPSGGSWPRSSTPTSSRSTTSSQHDGRRLHRHGVRRRRVACARSGTRHREEEGAPLPVAQAIAYMLEILPAFGYLHRRGLLFCDFKPDNVIQTEEQLKLIDLGGVRRMDDDGERPLRHRRLPGARGARARCVGGVGPLHRGPDAGRAQHRLPGVPGREALRHLAPARPTTCPAFAALRVVPPVPREGDGDRSARPLPVGRRDGRAAASGCCARSWRPTAAARRRRRARSSAPSWARRPRPPVAVTSRCRRWTPPTPRPACWPRWPRRPRRSARALLARHAGRPSSPQHGPRRARRG